MAIVSHQGRGIKPWQVQRGIDICHETVTVLVASVWANVCRADPQAACRGGATEPLALASGRGLCEDPWRAALAEQHYLWRAVGQEGEVLERFVTKCRDKKAALKFLKKTLKRHGRAEKIVTDRLRAYAAALRERGISDAQETDRWANNRAKNAAPTLLKTRAGDAALAPHANVTTVRIRSCLDLQPFQQGTQPLQPAERQGQT